MPAKLGCYLHSYRLGAVPAIFPRQRRRNVCSRHRKPHGQGEDVDIYSVGERKRYVALRHYALRHYMDTDRQTREATTGSMTRGFSLIEVMIATVVLVVGLLGG